MPGSERLTEPLYHLHEELGKTLNPDLASKDPFYMLDEIFRLFAASEHQFLNLMKAKVESLAIFDEERSDNISELQTIKRLVDRHAEQLEDLLPIIRARGGSDWPRATVEAEMSVRSYQPQETAPDATREASERLTVMFQKIQRRTCAVSSLCQDSIAMLGNDTMMREAQKGMKQAEGVAKVTLIAFVFVPLSFVTSFFGMNFVELDGNKLRLWIWFVVSTPILIVSMLGWWMNRARRRKFWQWAEAEFSEDTS
ncbi:hypothetical protein QQX98_003325 [Neonectria punicea]|uniref:Uncharacterized protein n=1 Tax=Neonectria punicea TaxID=979145 RepID=A0ABR1HF30_9HYPO